MAPIPRIVSESELESGTAPASQADTLVTFALPKVVLNTLHYVRLRATRLACYPCSGTGGPPGPSEKKNKARQIPISVLIVTATKGFQPGQQADKRRQAKRKEDLGRYAPILGFLAI
jgi:hypothetical protein